MSETTSTIEISKAEVQDSAPMADGRPIIAMLGDDEAGGCCGGGSCAI